MSKIDHILKTAITIIGGSALIIMMLAIVANVIGRMIWDSPFYGMVEIVSLSGVFLLSCAIAFAEKSRSHLIITIVSDKLRKHFRTILRIVSTITCIVMAVLLVYSGFQMAIEDWVTPGATTYVLHLNKGPFRMVWVIGAVVLCFFLIQNLVRVIKQVKNK